MLNVLNFINNKNIFYIKNGLEASMDVKYTSQIVKRNVYKLIDDFTKSINNEQYLAIDSKAINNNTTVFPSFGISTINFMDYQSQSLVNVSSTNISTI